MSDSLRKLRIAPDQPSPVAMTQQDASAAVMSLASAPPRRVHVVDRSTGIVHATLGQGEHLLFVHPSLPPGVIAAEHGCFMVACVELGEFDGGFPYALVVVAAEHAAAWLAFPPHGRALLMESLEHHHLSQGRLH